MPERIEGIEYYGNGDGGRTKSGGYLVLVDREEYDCSDGECCGEVHRTANIDIYERSTVPLSKYRYWKDNDKYDIYEYDKETAALALMNAFLGDDTDELARWVRHGDADV